MSGACEPRFEVVHSDAGWFARFRASNGRKLWQTEVYTRKAAALVALDSLARPFSATNQVWIETEGPLTPPSRASVGVGSEGHSSFASATRVPLRTVDERTER